MATSKNIKKKTKVKTGTYKNILQKIAYYKGIVQKTVLSIQKYKTLDIVTASDINTCIDKLQEIYQILNNIENSVSPKSKNINNIVNRLQDINNEITFIFQKYGTESINDLISIVFGQNYLNEQNIDVNKLDVVNKYLHPINYKILNWGNNGYKNNNKRLARNKIVEDFMIVETANTLDCFDLSRTSNIFQLKVYGIKICFQNLSLKKTLIVQCIADDVLVNCCDDPYINMFLKNINKSVNTDFNANEFSRFISSLSLKEFLIYDRKELFHKFVGFCNQNKLMKQRTISEIIKDFLNADLYKQRAILIQLLLKNDNPEFQYLSYLLYDLLSNENNGSIDTQEQTLLFDSLPWSIKKFFKNAMKNTIDYTKKISNFESNKIPLEQQICLLKAPNSVKEKAMVKLKEIKSKTEDSGSKARAYLEGLLKIPFGTYKSEKLLSLTDTIGKDFNELINKIKEYDEDFDIPTIDKYTNNDVISFTNFIKNNYLNKIKTKSHNSLINNYINNKRDQLVSNICFINNIFKKHNIKKRICHSGKKSKYMKDEITKCISDYSNNQVIYNEFQNNKNNNNINIIENINVDISNINSNWNTISNEMNNITDILDKSVHGHKHAKRQIERIIGQWVTGKQTGYCFGFEGPPGVGKTSLARKGLANCLKNNNGDPRPFSFIAVGGASNGSTIAGHNYTYVGSTWGKIVDILIDKKCMNPIIFIDELDKISKTENGKEIIGILTHLIDTTQNEQFQDKYFSGIDLDLSKALFIFSYNDVSAIDRILLDRIHRIKFKHLSLQDKLTICNSYILPEFYEKFNMKDMKITDEILTYIIQHYTNESGVRKLKEILFEILSEVNLQILKNYDKDNCDIVINVDTIKKLYLKNKNEAKEKKIHTQPQSGIINGLWANALGMGGIIPIESSFMPSNTFLDLNLTGLQGDVMKESMNVAKTLAWKLTPNTTKTKLLNSFKKSKMQCIHIHCPEGAVPKDGPSAGTAITTCIYSLFNNKKIKNDIAITGEINLQGQVTAIGGLELKILGGIRAGVKTFIFPKENLDDFEKIKSETHDLSIFNDIKFISVSNIKEVLNCVFVE